jgi:hypothetical protein
MEFHIVDCDALVASSHSGFFGLFLHQQFIVHAELALRHPRQQTFQFNSPCDLGPEHSALDGHQTMDLLNNINKDLIPPMDNTLGPPGSDPSGLGGELPELLQILEKFLIEATLLNELLEDLRIHNLWASEIHNLIQDLIDQTEVLLDLLFVQFPTEIGLADEDQLVQELDHHGGVDVGFCSGEEDDVFVGDVDVASTLEHQDGVVTVLLRGHDL